MPEELIEVEIGNLAKNEFRVMFEKMIKELGKRMDTQSKKLFFFFIKDWQTIKNNQTEMNKEITKIFVSSIYLRQMKTKTVFQNL